MKTILTAFLIYIPALFASAQTGNVVLIEEFTETGCGACSQYDSSFQALTNANADKIAVINYHCYYLLDPFYSYCKACDYRFSSYRLNDGFPAAVVNGKKPGNGSSHIANVSGPMISSLYNRPPEFKLEISSTSKGKRNTHAAVIAVKATALKNNPAKNLRLFVVITENNINYRERYHAEAANGINDFNHIMRAMLTDTTGTHIGPQLIGKISKAKFSYTNDDAQLNYKEVRIVAFIQDADTKEVFSAAVSTKSPFK